MSKICEISGKRPTVVKSVTRRGKAKAQGGVGKKTTGLTKRWQYPNLQVVTVKVADQEISFRVATTHSHKVYELAERVKGMKLDGLNAKQIKTRMLGLL
jgi:large subunit ribosomal protein L28